MLALRLYTSLLSLRAIAMIPLMTQMMVGTMWTIAMTDVDQRTTTIRTAGLRKRKRPTTPFVDVAVPAAAPAADASVDFASNPDDADELMGNFQRGNGIAGRRQQPTPPVDDPLDVPVDTASATEPGFFTRENDGVGRRSNGKRDRERSLIIGGQSAPIDRYPYAVSLENSNNLHYCTGSLIAPDVVLTAAHCTGLVTKAIVGRYDLDDPTDGHEMTNVKSEISHPDFDSQSLNHDVMVLILEKVTTAPYVTINANESMPEDGSRLVVMGWGDIHQDEAVFALSDELRETEVIYETNEECENREGTLDTTQGQTTIRFANSISKYMMCAIDDDDTPSDACNGDSGGPLIISGEDDLGADDVHVGIVSWGIGCANPQFPGVYARTSAHYDFLRETVCKHSLSPPPYLQCDPRNVKNPGALLPPSIHRRSDNVAVYNPMFRSPFCEQVGRSCDSGPELLLGRANVSNGAEPNTPNTVDLCPDGKDGAFHTDESIDRIKISTTNNEPFSPYVEVKVDATLWPYADGSQNSIDFYYAPNRSQGWLYIGTERPTTGKGLQIVSKKFNLMGGSYTQAIRVSIRWHESTDELKEKKSDACSRGNYDDVDDLVFTLSEDPI